MIVLFIILLALTFASTKGAEHFLANTGTGWVSYAGFFVCFYTAIAAALLTIGLAGVLIYAAFNT